MLRSFFYLLIIVLSCTAYAQQVIEMATLNDSINETSGLLYLNGKIVSHNDSGDGPFLYEIDSLTGSVSRTVFVENAQHIDWEDITSDTDFIYIGDFGNNNGDRTDLRIYKLTINDYINSLNDTVSIDTIQFSYSDQTDFTSSAFSTNFDAEAFISIGDSLYIFTKNWLDNKTNIYSISKNTGIQTAVKIDSLDSQGLVGGADYNAVSQQIILCGYATVNPFILTINQFTASNFSAGTIDRSDIALNGSSQLEGICSISANQHYISTETNFTGDPKLHKLNLETGLGIRLAARLKISLYPNPASKSIHLQGLQPGDEITIYNSIGTKVLSTISTSNLMQINTEHLPSGIFILHISNDEDFCDLRFIKS